MNWKNNHPGLVVYGEKMSLCAVFTPMSLNKAQFYSKLAPQPSIKLPLMVQTNEWLTCHWHSPGCAPSPAQSADSSQQCAAECVKPCSAWGSCTTGVWFSRAQACFLWYLSFCSLRSRLKLQVQTHSRLLLLNFRLLLILSTGGFLGIGGMCKSSY